MIDTFYSLSFFAKAFFALLSGFFTFLAPCTLPIVPGYIGYLAGFSQKKSVVVSRSLLFVLGFSCVFLLFGGLAGLLGFFIGDLRDTISTIGGVLITLLGVAAICDVALPFLYRGGGFSGVGGDMSFLSTPSSAFLLGASFGAGWSPCIGPVLGSILTLAATSTHGLEGVTLLAVFCVGLGTPFLLIALGVDRADRYIQKYPTLLRVGRVGGGIVLIMIGILLMTHSFGYFASSLFRVFSFMQYDAILKYL